MGKLILHATTTEEILGEIERVTATRVIASERDGRTVYAAVQAGETTRALILQLTPLPAPLESGENLIVTVNEETHNPEPARASRHVTRHLSTALFAPADLTWRERCAQWQAHTDRAKTGEVLLGTYPEAEGGVGYNPEAKQAFERNSSPA